MYDTVVISKSVFQQATILFGVGPLARRYLLCSNFPKKKNLIKSLVLLFKLSSF